MEVIAYYSNVKNEIKRSKTLINQLIKASDCRPKIAKNKVLTSLKKMSCRPKLHEFYFLT